MKAICSLATVLGKQLIENWPFSFVSCVREETCADGVRMFDVIVEMAFVKSGFRSGGNHSSLDDCDGPYSVVRAWRTERCVLREKTEFAGQKCQGPKRVLNSFLTVRRKETDTGS